MLRGLFFSYVLDAVRGDSFVVQYIMTCAGGMERALPKARHPGRCGKSPRARQRGWIRRVSSYESDRESLRKKNPSEKAHRSVGPPVRNFTFRTLRRSPPSLRKFGGVGAIVLGLHSHDSLKWGLPLQLPRTHRCGLGLRVILGLAFDRALLMAPLDLRCPTQFVSTRSQRHLAQNPARRCWLTDCSRKPMETGDYCLACTAWPGLPA